MSRLILLRHGQSAWNKKNLFTGWIDIPLSQEGIAEALHAGETIKKMAVDMIFCSTLVRGIMTAMLAMSVHESGKVPYVLHPGEGRMEEWGKCHSPQTDAELIPTLCAWELNERMYGTLQGMNKQEMRATYGDEQVQIWRRSFDVEPPQGESLKMTAERTLPFFCEKILPHLKDGKNILISAHGNSLRSIVMYLDQLTPEQVVNLEIPTGKPFFYTYSEGNLRKDERVFG